MSIKKYKIERAIFLAISASAAYYAATWAAYAALITSAIAWSVSSISDRCAEGAAISAAKLRAVRDRITDPEILDAVDLALRQGRDLVECSGKLPGRSLAAQVGATVLSCLVALVPTSEALAGLAATANARLAALRGECPRAAALAAAWTLLGVAYSIGWGKLYRPARWSAEARMGRG